MQAERGAPLITSRLALFTALASTGLWLDLSTKEWAKVALVDRDIEVIQPILRFNLTFNPGAAFSTWTGATPVLTAIAAAAAIAIPVAAWRASHLPWAIALGFLHAGVLGNLANRVFEGPGPGRGHVVDFIQLPNFPLFNVADICINIAAALMLVLAWRGIKLDGSRDSDG